MNDADNRPAVVGQVERPVRPDPERAETWCEALRSQGLTWSQVNFAVSITRNFAHLAREQALEDAAKVCAALADAADDTFGLIAPALATAERDIRALKDISAHDDKDIRQQNNATQGKTIHALNISSRVHNCLLREGVVTLRDLMLLSASDVLRMPNIGTKHIKEIGAAMDAIGVVWPGKADAIRALKEPSNGWQAAKHKQKKDPDSTT